MRPPELDLPERTSLSPESLSALPHVLEARSKLEAKVLIVSRYVASAHRGDALLLRCVLALGVAANRGLRRAARSRRRIARQGIVVVRRSRAPPSVLPRRRFHVERRGVGLEIRIYL